MIRLLGDLVSSVVAALNGLAEGATPEPWARRTQPGGSWYSPPASELPLHPIRKGSALGVGQLGVDGGGVDPGMPQLLLHLG